jgi:type I restriction enzyme S subunit
MNLPQGWTMYNLTSFCSIRTGKYDANHAVENGKYRFYTCSTTYSFCNTKSFEGECVIIPGNGDIGQVYYYEGEFEAYQRTYVLEKINILPRYLYHHLFWNWRHINSDKQYGSTVRYIRIGNFLKYIVFFPPLPEQRRIVAKIDSLFSELDNGVALLKTIKAQLAVYRQAVLKWAFEGKLTEEWRKLNCVMAWKYVTIEKFLVKIDKSMSTGPFGTMLKKHEHQSAGVPVLGIENIGNGVFIHGNKIFVTPDKAEYLKSFVLHTNDVIISRSGTVGELCLVPQQFDGSLMSTNLIRVTLDENVIIPKFFVFLFQSKGIVIDQVKELCKGSTRAFLNQTILKKISFPLLAIDEQRQIIDEIESRLSVCDKLEQTIDKTLALSASLRQSILKKAFEGRLVPQDPNDEPAEKLLERIRAEKAAVSAKQKQTRKRGGK